MRGRKASGVPDGRPRNPAVPGVPSLRWHNVAYTDRARGSGIDRSRATLRGRAATKPIEVELVERYGAGKDVLECGVGTGLLLERFACFARSARGIDLSPGMLERARARGLDVREASVTALPFDDATFDDATFDVTCSFKVLAHVPEIGRALAEMARVTRPGGVVIAEFYSALSVRGLVKRLGPGGRHLGEPARERRLHALRRALGASPASLPPSLLIEAARGVRIVTQSRSHAVTQSRSHAERARDAGPRGARRRAPHGAAPRGHARGGARRVLRWC